MKQMSRPYIPALLGLTLMALTSCAPAPGPVPSRETAVLKAEIASLKEERAALNDQLRLLQEDLKSMRSQMPAESAPSEPSVEAVIGAGTEEPAEIDIDSQLAAARDFREAYAFFSTGDYPEASAAFDRFVSTYPSNKFAGNARYWQGVSLVKKEELQGAIERFGEVIEYYPESGRAPDALEQMIALYQQLGETELAAQASETLRLLYPYSDPARRVRTAERSNH